jgi:HAD superfamily hydrolase (TIGR01509 family)
MGWEKVSMRVQGVMLDVDGTLVLSNDAHARAWVEAYQAFGYQVAFGDVRRLIGMGGDRLVPALTPDLNADEGAGKRIAERRKEIFLSQLAPGLKPAPGARALVEEMRRRGLRLIVVSSATPDELQPLLRAAQVDDLLPDATTKGDVSRSKPAPDPVAMGLERLGLPPDACVMLGDTPYDIESAAKAGAPTIAVRCGGWSDLDLRGALAIYDDPAELLARYDESPLAGGAPMIPYGEDRDAPRP